MKFVLTVLMTVSVMIAAPVSWAYGGGGSSSSKACDKPKFTEFLPADKSEVEPGSEFSFTTSVNTHPETIKVSIKDIPVNIQIEDKKSTAFKVSGKFPESLHDTYARISINAEASNACKGNGGWLVKILK